VPDGRYAHDRGVLHRDLKPANIMLGDYGETLVVDWGLAKVLNQDEREQTDSELAVRLRSGRDAAPTEMGQVIGTPAFMPPEQALGQLNRMGVASDVFSLGAILYCLLTGQSPYSGEDVLTQAQRGEVVPVRRRKRSVPAALEAVCAKAMAKKPQNRYASARALALEVQRWLADEPVDARQEPIADRVRRWGWRNGSWLTRGAGGLGVLLCVAIAAVIFVASLWRPAPFEPHSSPAAPLDRLRREDIPASERFDWQPEQLVQVLGSHRGRHWGEDRFLAVTPDGNRVVTAGGNSRLVQVWDTATLQPLHSPHDSYLAPSAVTGLGLLKDGRTLLIGTRDPGGSLVVRWQIGSKQAAEVHVRNVRANRFSPDGRRALWAYSHSVLSNLETGKLLRQSEAYPLTGNYLGTAFSHDGKQALVAWQPRGSIARLDTASGKILQTYRQAHKGEVTALAFLPDGKSFLSGGYGDGVKLFSPDEEPQALEANSLITVIAVSRNGKRAAWGSARWWVPQITCWDLEKRQLLRRLGEARESQHISLTFLSAGRLLSGDFGGGLHLWDVETGKELVPLDRPADTMYGVTFAPESLFEKLQIRELWLRRMHQPSVAVTA
jgi:WD40 repeat protein